jgi:5'-3' exonuclease
LNLEDHEIEQGSNWDRNQITPGTPFMKKVADSLKFYIIGMI